MLLLPLLVQFLLCFFMPNLQLTGTLFEAVSLKGIQWLACDQCLLSLVSIVWQVATPASGQSITKIIIMVYGCGPSVCKWMSV